MGGERRVERIEYRVESIEQTKSKYQKSNIKMTMQNPKMNNSKRTDIVNIFASSILTLMGKK